MLFFMEVHSLAFLLIPKAEKKREESIFLS